jgi:DNA-binding FrmR family transcriptional regulator
MKQEKRHEHNEEHDHGSGHGSVENGHMHFHKDAQGNVCLHHHDPEDMKSIVNRLARAIGHLESVKRMVEDDRDCTEVLVQLAAVRSAINNCGKEILKEHISHCIVDAVQQGDEKSISELNDAIDKFMKA